MKYNQQVGETRYLLPSLFGEKGENVMFAKLICNKSTNKI